MESRAKLLGHPIHPMLIPFPIGLLVTSVIFDIVLLARGTAPWGIVSFWMIGAGIIGGVLAAIFGVVDWVSIPRGTRAKSIGLLHALTNAVALAMFAVSWVLRLPEPEAPGVAAHALAFLGVAVLLVGGWLGGELVDRLGVGVDPGAHVDSPSALTRRPAREFARGVEQAAGRFAEARGPEREVPPMPTGESPRVPSQRWP